MSEDDFSDPYDEPSMEISIETLTGTSFDMRVYPTDTILDIKNKIQRVEGIPAHHQNLLFQLKELQDFKRLNDLGIVNGSKLKLVLSMRGGPISTRRLSTCDHHIVWKDLKDLIEHTRDEIGEKLAHKVSVLVFKDGEVINLIRVIENEDGSYTPCSEKTITPPFKTNEKEDTQVCFFKKITEDMEMASKMHVLKSKMKNLSDKRQIRNYKPNEIHTKSKISLTEQTVDELGYLDELAQAGSLRSTRLAYKLLNDHIKTTEQHNKCENKIMIQENFVHHDNSEIGEIALKDKHRSKMKVTPSNLDKSCKKPTSNTEPSLNKPSLDTHAHRKYNASENKLFSCRNLHVFEPETGRPSRTSDKEQKDEKIINGSVLSPLYNRYPPENLLKCRKALHYDSKLNLDELNGSKVSESIAILEDPTENEDEDMLTSIEVPCAETVSLSARNRVHLTHLVLKDSSERTKSSPDSIELEEKSQELWEIQPEPMKKSGAYKVGLVKRRASVDHNYDADFSLESPTSKLNIAKDDYNVNSEEYNYKNSDYEVFGRNFYHLPQYVSAPSAIPPQYAPKDERICDLYLGSPVTDSKMHRSPLYGRRAKTNARDVNSFTNVDYNSFAEEASRNLENLGKSFEEMQNSGGAIKRTQRTDTSFVDTSSSIERLHNDFTDVNSFVEFDTSSAKYSENLDELFGFYNAKSTNELDKILNCHHPKFKDYPEWMNTTARPGDLSKPKNKSSDTLADEIQRLGIFDDTKAKIQIETAKLEDLPNLNKKRMRCGQCNKRLNITNIYNCRCGRIFCSQHRYSEAHDCKFDYKTEGRKLLEQQNPLVTASKLPKF